MLSSPVLLVTLHPVAAIVGVILLAARVGDPGALREPRGEGGQADARGWGEAAERPRSACSATSSATTRASCTRARAW